MKDYLKYFIFRYVLLYFVLSFICLFIMPTTAFYHYDNPCCIIYLLSEKKKSSLSSSISNPINNHPYHFSLLNHCQFIISRISFFSVMELLLHTLFSFCFIFTSMLLDCPLSVNDIWSYSSFVHSISKSLCF